MDEIKWWLVKGDRCVYHQIFRNFCVRCYDHISDSVEQRINGPRIHMVNTK